MHGDELYDRARFPSEVHYFHCPAEAAACISSVDLLEPVENGLFQMIRHTASFILYFDAHECRLLYGSDNYLGIWL